MHSSVEPARPAFGDSYDSRLVASAQINYNGSWLDEDEEENAEFYAAEAHRIEDLQKAEAMLNIEATRLDGMLYKREQLAWKKLEREDDNRLRAGDTQAGRDVHLDGRYVCTHERVCPGKGLRLTEQRKGDRQKGAAGRPDIAEQVVGRQARRHPAPGQEL